MVWTTKILTLKDPGLQRSDTQPKPFTVDRNGFSLNVLHLSMNLCVVA